MPPSIFYLAGLVMLAAYLIGAARRRRAMQEGLPEGSAGVRHGPVPGYAYLPAPAIRFDPTDPPPGIAERWRPISLETLHAGPRTRIILTIRAEPLPPPTELFTLMKPLAQRLAQRTHAAAVAVRLLGEGPVEAAPIAELVYAPDRAGWTGTASDAELTVSLPGREPFRMAT